MKKQILVGIAEDHGLVREGIISLLNQEANIKVVLEASNGADLLEKLKKTKIDLILLDLEMPVLSGHEAFKTIRSEYPDIKIIIISALFQQSFVVEYVKKDVNGFLPKDCSSSQLIETINGVYSNGNHFSPEILKMVSTAVTERKTFLKADFSERELAIVQLMCQDKSSKEIAEALSLSVRTVEWHRQVLLTKANVNTSAALVIFAVKNKLVDI